MTTWLKLAHADDDNSATFSKFELGKGRQLISFKVAKSSALNFGPTTSNLDMSSSTRKSLSLWWCFTARFEKRPSTPKQQSPLFDPS